MIGQISVNYYNYYLIFSLFWKNNVNHKIDLSEELESNYKILILMFDLGFNASFIMLRFYIIGIISF